jgi:hypothetical protein
MFYYNFTKIYFKYILLISIFGFSISFINYKYSKDLYDYTFELSIGKIYSLKTLNGAPLQSDNDSIESILNFSSSCASAMNGQAFSGSNYFRTSKVSNGNIKVTMRSDSIGGLESCAKIILDLYRNNQNQILKNNNNQISSYKNELQASIKNYYFTNVELSAINYQIFNSQYEIKSFKPAEIIFNNYNKVPINKFVYLFNTVVLTLTVAFLICALHLIVIKKFISKDLDNDNI